jgi:hypothetical protein
MTKFSGENDSGYVRVRDQLWFWVDTLDASERKLELASGHAQTVVQNTMRAAPESGVVPAYEGRNIVNNENMEDRHRGENSIATGGGAVFMANVNAGRDFTYNHN